jgi:DsbC/DsbD-like thiol-disulfide interchange protein
MAWTLRQTCTVMVLAVTLVALAPGEPLLANPVTTAHVQTELGSTVTTIQPGASFWVILHLRMQEGWHTYWQNPGDAGLPTAIRWVLPDGFTPGNIVWPYPQRLPVGPLMNYGYEGEVALLTQMTAPADLPPGQLVTLQAQTTWVVCADLCVPGAATLDLQLPVSAVQPQEDARWMAVFAQTQAALPKPAPWQVVFSAAPDMLTLLVAGSDFVATRLVEATFFPLAYGIIDHAAPQQVQITPQGLRLTLRRGTFDITSLTRIDGVLVLQETRNGASHVQAFMISAVPARAS